MDGFKLIQKYEPLIWKMIRKRRFSSKVIDYDDLYQRVCEEILRAAPKLEEDRIENELGFIGTIIHRSITKEIGESQWGGRWVNATDAIGSKRRDDRELISLGEWVNTIPFEEGDYAHVEGDIDAYRLKEQIKKDTYWDTVDKNILIKVIDGESVKVIADDLNITTQTVYNRLEKMQWFGPLAKYLDKQHSKKIMSERISSRRDE